jgi:hypothetical protein
VPEGTRNAIVYLALPVRQPGSVEIVQGEASEGRYGLQEFEAYDTHSASPLPAALQVGRLRLRYILESQRQPGYVCIGLARIAEVAPDRRVTLDDRWIPPALVCSAVPPLSGLLAELSGMLNQRGEELAARLTAPDSRGVADFLWLQSTSAELDLLNRLDRIFTRPARAGMNPAVASPETVPNLLSNDQTQALSRLDGFVQQMAELSQQVDAQIAVERQAEPNRRVVIAQADRQRQAAVNARLKLPRFCGHRNVCVQGVGDGQDKATLCA